MAAVESCMASNTSSSVLPVLLRRPRAPVKSQYNEIIRKNKSRQPTEACSKTNQPLVQKTPLLNIDYLLNINNFELQPPVTTIGHDRPKRPVIFESEKLPAHHTSLLELSAVSDVADNSQSLVMPRKSRGPDPLPARQPRKKPTILHVPLDEDLYQFYQPPQFTLSDFIVRFAAEENVPADNVQHTIFSRYTYERLQAILLERCQTRATRLAVQDLHIPDDVAVGPQRIPQRQLVAEIALAIKEQLCQMSGMEVKSSIRAPVNISQGSLMRPGSCAEIVFYRDHSAEYEQQLSQLLQVSEVPGADSIVHGPASRYFIGSRRSDSPFGLIDENPISPSELSVLDCLFNGGRALSLKAQFISDLPNVQLLRETVEYVNLSFNNFKDIPIELFEMPSLTVLLMRNNPLREISAEVCRLCNLKICVISFGLLTLLPSELFALSQLEHLDVSYNLLTEISTEITNLTKLVELNVEGNQLVGMPFGLARLKNLRYLKVRNNWMHPVFWRDASAAKPQRLVDLSSRVANQIATVGGSTLPSDVIDALATSLKCDICRGPRYGSGFLAIRPVEKIAGVKNVPLLFNCCSAECKLDFLSRKDGLLHLLYGSRTSTS